MSPINTFFADIFKVLFGQLKPGEHIAPYSGSVIFFAITMLVGWTLRTLNKKLSSKATKPYIAIFLATLECCAYFLENNFIYAHYGGLALFLAVIVECLIAERTFLGACANPTAEFAMLIENKITFKTALSRVSVQALAGIASFSFSRIIWAMDLVPDHRARYLETSCTSDLTVVFWFGCLLEMAATMIEQWMGRQILLTEAFADEILKHGVSSILFVLGIQYTGMYFNPAMATGHMFGCRGTTEFEHVFVYWAGPFVGCYAAIHLDKLLHIDVTSRRRSSRLIQAVQ